MAQLGAEDEGAAVEGGSPSEEPVVEGGGAVVAEEERIMREARRAVRRLRALREAEESEEAPSTPPSGDDDVDAVADADTETDEGLTLTIDLDGVDGDSVENVNVAVDGKSMSGGDDDQELLADEGDGDESSMPELPALASSSSGDSGEGDEEEPSSALAEATIRARKVARRFIRENRALKAQLAETQLLTARSLYLNKLFVRENLSTAQRKRIVEYLDSARTLAEAKEVYNRITRVLDAAAAATPSAARRPATTKATTAPRLNESAARTAPAAPTGPMFDVGRLQKLAGIVKK
jgi:hypothetical protein